MSSTQESQDQVYASPVDYDAYGTYAVKNAKLGEDGFDRPLDLYPFRGRLSADGSTEYPAEPGRYHLYLAWSCPWAQRAAIVRKLAGLSDLVSASYVHGERDGRGWAFREDTGPDPVNGFTLLRQAYDATHADYPGHISVPVLWDKQTHRIVSNFFPDLTIDLATQFEGQSESGTDLYPPRLRADIDTLNDTLYNDINNAVYVIGNEPDQATYDTLVHRLFQTLDTLERRLAGNRFLFGNRITESDVRLWVTLARFDAVYHGLFKVNLRRLVDYPHLWAYARDLYQRPAFRETTDFAAIKRGYYTGFAKLNPYRIVPAGPMLDWDAPTDRDHLS
jgi:putative glutathione S-transferase